jgi:hypothetical protein
MYPNSHRGFRNSPQEIAWVLEGPWDSRCHWVHANLCSSRFPAYLKEYPEYLKFLFLWLVSLFVLAFVFAYCICGVSIYIKTQIKIKKGATTPPFKNKYV